MEQDGSFHVVRCWTIAGLYDRDAELPRVGSPLKAVARHSVCMIPTGAQRIRREGVASTIMPLHHWRSSLGCTVNVRWNMKTVPVNNFRIIGFIDDVDRDALTRRQPEDRAWDLPVICLGSH